MYSQSMVGACVHRIDDRACPALHPVREGLQAEPLAKGVGKTDMRAVRPLADLASKTVFRLCAMRE
ncbi:hypothetical protein CHELA41_24401 [Hyphomicrobiales bacterium]|nr:hypothetical protein CHELA41_24401 [Hyphomicrobiales bacterium]